jgi:hypothetical protein
MTATDHVSNIQTAFAAFNAARERVADAIGGKPGPMLGFFGQEFWSAWETLLLAVRDSVRHAENEPDGPLMRRLVSVLDGVQRGIQFRRQIDSDRINSPESNLYRFLNNIDNGVSLAIRRLSEPPQPPRIQTVKQMAAAGCATPAIMNEWRHLGVVTVEAIIHGLADDVPTDQHPEVVKWRKEQSEFPAGWDDSALCGACREIERSRERNTVEV